MSKEQRFYDLKSAAESALHDLRICCEKIGRDWKDELEDVIADAERES